MYKITPNSKLYLGGVAAALLSLSSPALAEPRQLEEVIVLAQKRAQNLQDVPIAVSAFDNETLVAANVKTTLDLPLRVPSLSIPVTNGFARVSMRGVTNTNSQPQVPSAVAVYIDDVYVGSPAMNVVSLLGTERVEVLKGPQGTLYGRNTVGGAVKVYTLTPTQDFEGRLSLGAGNLSSKEFSGYVSGALGEKVSAGIYLGGRRSDPYVDQNISNPIAPKYDEDYDEERGIRLKTVITPTDWLDITMSWEKSESHSYSNSAFVIGNPNNLFYLVTGTPAVLTPYEVNSTQPDFHEIDNENAKLRIDADLGWANLISITGYNDHNFDAHIDLLDTDVTFLGFPNGSTNESVSQEIQFLSPEGSAVEWIGGAFYYNQEAGSNDNDGTTNTLHPIFCTTLGLPAVACPVIDADTGIAAGNNGRVDFESWAVFGQFTMPVTSISENLRLTVGGRYTVDTQKVKGDLYTIAYDRTTGATFGPKTIYGRVESPEEEWKEFTPKITLDYSVDDTLYYFTWAEGYQEGVFNLSQIDLSALGPVEPQEMTSFEIGIKTQLWNGRARLNAAAFHYSIENMQVQTTAGAASVLAVIQNAAEATINGVEADFEYAASDNLSLRAAFAYLDTEYDEYPNSASVDRVPGLGFNSPIPGGLDVSGNEVAQTPEIVTSVGASYFRSVESIGANLNASVDWYWNGGFYWTPANFSFQEEESYSLVNASLGLAWDQFEHGELSVTLWGSNLLDEEVVSTLADTTFTDLYNYFPPRTYGLRVTWSM